MQRLEGASVERAVVVGERERAYPLADGYGSLEVVWVEADVLVDQRAVREPGAQRRGVDEDFTAVLGRQVVMGVEEGLHEGEAPGRGGATAGLWGAVVEQFSPAKLACT